MKIPDKMLVLTPAAAAATSLILKDAVGCVLYVTQARSNKQMDIKQRADVANYDLMNGIINVGLQLAAVKPIEKAMNKLVDSKFLAKFYKNLDSQLSEGGINKILKNISKHEGTVKGAVTVLSTVICQYLIKRVASPYLSVPAGEWSKQKGFVKPVIYPGENADEYYKQHPNVKRPKSVSLNA